MKKIIGIIIAILILFTYVLFTYMLPEADKDVESVIINGRDAGLTFGGIGTLMSNGKLIYDYPEPQRGEILDFLFKPGFGEEFQILRIDLGVDSSNGQAAWPAHKRSAGEEPDFNRGYGWWYMLEAKKRNPDIILSALNWGWPGYCTTDELKADYLFSFVKGAKEVHGLTIDYINGNQNEADITPGITKLLRKMLDEAGFTDTKIIAADEGSTYEIAEYLKDKEYADIVDIIGIHRFADGAPPQIITDLGIPVWNSGDGGGRADYFTSGLNCANWLMNQFQFNKFSGIIGWAATADLYPNKPWPHYGTIQANQPWSGHYIIGTNVWANAHFNQFVKPGWKILNQEKDYLYKSLQGLDFARYVAFKDSNSGNYTIVIVTNQKDFPETGVDIEFKITGGLSKNEIFVRQSKCLEQKNFMAKPSITPKNSRFTVHLEKDSIYTLTTTWEGGKGETVIPRSTPMPLPYYDDFNNSRVGGQGKYFIDLDSAFEITNTGGKEGNVLRQAVPLMPQHWHPLRRVLKQPATEIGDMTWTDYKVGIDVLIENTGAALLGGRFSGRETQDFTFMMDGIWLELNDDASWELFVLKPLSRDSTVPLYTRVRRHVTDKNSFITLAAGNLTGEVLGKWFRMELEFNGKNIKAYINGNKVADVNDGTIDAGNVCLATLSGKNFYDDSGAAQAYCHVQFDNLLIEPVK